MTPGEIVLDGRRLETAWWGPRPDEAPTLVLLHEGLGCVALWRDLPERLVNATGCGVFAYSRFGYGQSDPVMLPRPMTYMHHEALSVLPRVLDAAGIARAILIGHSDGGSIAAIYAGASRNRTVIPRSPPTVIPRLVRGTSRGTTLDQGPPDEPGDDGGAIAGLILIAAHFFVENQNIAAIAQIRTEYETTDLRSRLARRHANPDNAFRGWNDAWLDPRFRDFDITGYLSTISVPVLALQGTDDPYGTAAQLQALERHVRSPLQTLLIEGARHAPHLEATDKTLAAIVRFARTNLMELRK